MVTIKYEGKISPTRISITRLIYNNNCNNSADYYYNNLRKNICQDDNISIK